MEKEEILLSVKKKIDEFWEEHLQMRENSDYNDVFFSNEAHWYGIVLGIISGIKLCLGEDILSSKDQYTLYQYLKEKLKSCARS